VGGVGRGVGGGTAASVLSLGDVSSIFVFSALLKFFHPTHTLPHVSVDIHLFLSEF
jgi:hypothetical protein